MAEYKVYVCDKCKKETRDFKEMIGVDIKIGSDYYGKNPNYYNFKVSKSDIQLCTECAKKFGVIKKAEDKDHKYEKSETLEDKIYEIVEEIVGNILDNQ